MAVMCNNVWGDIRATNYEKEEKGLKGFFLSLTYF